MNAGMKLATVYVAGALLVAGCGQSNSGGAGTSPSQPVAAQSQSSQSSQQKSSVNSVDGYKSFKFGMKPTELAKLAECAPDDYDEKIAAEIVELTGKIPSPEMIQGGPYRYEIEAQRLNKQIDKLKNNKEGSYLNILHCQVNFAGNDYHVRMDASSIQTDAMGTLMGLVQGAALYFNNQEQLGGVQIPLGNFNQEKLNSLIQELQGKYPLSSTPSDVAIATANREIGAQVSWFFANNGVELRLINGGPDKLMVLYYHDAISAKKAFEGSQKGKVSSGDL